MIEVNNIWQGHVYKHIISPKHSITPPYTFKTRNNKSGEADPLQPFKKKKSEQDKAHLLKILGVYTDEHD